MVELAGGLVRIDGALGSILFLRNVEKKGDIILERNLEYAGVS